MIGVGSPANSLVERVYEAAVATDLWTSVLQEIADNAGARGAGFMVRAPGIEMLTVSPGIEAHTADYIAGGWTADATHASALINEMAPSFRTEADYHTPEQISQMPVHRHFLDPRGFISGAGTLFTGAANDILHVTVEGFPSHEAASAAIPYLNSLRPHLGRALSLAAAVRQVAADRIVQSLALAGVSAAVVEPRGRLRAANDRFSKRLDQRLIERQGRLAFADRHLDERFQLALALPAAAGVRSVAAPATQGAAAFVLHFVPIVGSARERLDSDGILILLAETSNASIPDSNLLRLLFDLSHAEARLARILLDGSTLVAAARNIGIAESTARTQLRSIYAKTGADRLTQLVSLLSGLGPPDDPGG